MGSIHYDFILDKKNAKVKTASGHTETIPNHDSGVSVLPSAVEDNIQYMPNNGHAIFDDANEGGYVLNLFLYDADGNKIKGEPMVNEVENIDTDTGSQTEQEAKDKAYLQSIIDGQVDVMADDFDDKLMAIAERYDGTGGEMEEMTMAAVNAYTAKLDELSAFEDNIFPYGVFDNVVDGTGSWNIEILEVTNAEGNRYPELEDAPRDTKDIGSVSQSDTDLSFLEPALEMKDEALVDGEVGVRLQQLSEKTEADTVLESVFDKAQADIAIPPLVVEILEVRAKD